MSRIDSLGVKQRATVEIARTARWRPPRSCGGERPVDQIVEAAALEVGSKYPASNVVVHPGLPPPLDGVRNEEAAPQTNIDFPEIDGYGPKRVMLVDRSVAAGEPEPEPEEAEVPPETFHSFLKSSKTPKRRRRGG